MTTEKKVVITLGSKVDPAMGQMLGGLASEFGRVGEMGMSLVGKGIPIAAVASLLAGAAAAAGEVVMKGKELNANIWEMHEKTGMSTQSMAGLQHIADAKRMDTGTILGMINKMELNAAKAKKAYHDLGIEAVESMPPDALFNKVMGGLAGIASRNEQVRVSTDIFGKGAAAVILPLLDNWKELYAEGVRLRGITDEEAKSAHEAEVAWGRMKSAMSGIAQQVAIAVGDLAPIVNTLLSLINGFGVKNIAGTGLALAGGALGIVNPVAGAALTYMGGRTLLRDNSAAADGAAEPVERVMKLNANDVRRGNERAGDRARLAMQVMGGY